MTDQESRYDKRQPQQGHIHRQFHLLTPLSISQRKFLFGSTKIIQNFILHVDLLLLCAFFRRFFFNGFVRHDIPSSISNISEMVGERKSGLNR
jgi:hypothetical protein